MNWLPLLLATPVYMICFACRVDSPCKWAHEVWNWRETSPGTPDAARATSEAVRLLVYADRFTEVAPVTLTIPAGQETGNFTCGFNLLGLPLGLPNLFQIEVRATTPNNQGITLVTVTTH